MLLIIQINNIKILCFDRIDVSEVADVNKTIPSKDSIIDDYFPDYLRGIFQIKGLSLNRITAMTLMIYLGCPWTLTMLLS